MKENFLLYSVFAVILVYVLNRIRIRLQLSKAKHPSLRGHSKWSRRITSRIPYFSYNESHYFSCDGAPEHIALQRKEALHNLATNVNQACSKTIDYCNKLEKSISDIQFTSNYRIPFPFQKLLPKAFKLGAITDETQGTKIKDLDGNWRFDLSGSYGVNVFGYDFYKDCMDKGFEQVKDLGPVLGSYHPIIGENVELIKRISGLDEVSFHMSGTEAVMQAVRLARYHTKKTHLVRFCGAYHGWWDGVQPGVGNRRKVNDVYTLADLSENALQVLSTRNDIACVLINPLQAFHPNSDSGSDSTLVASDRDTNFNKTQYTAWLKNIQEICNRRNIVLIFDEVFTGFRLGYRGAQGYFDVQADLVTYGKTLGGGLPVGVLAGQSHLMKRFRKDAPADVSFARGTFNSHPYVMGAMNEFLNRIQSPEIQNIYQTIEDVWDKRVEKFNHKLQANSLPIKITNMHSILSVLYTKPSRYNWMLQFYLKNAGLEMSWLGSGRMIMSFNFTDEEFEEVMTRFVQAALSMKNDGWWWHSAELTNKKIKRQFLFDMLTNEFPVLTNIMSSPIKSIPLKTDSKSPKTSTTNIQPIKEPLTYKPETKNTTIKKVS
ncbi:aminotransferase class III-fold pyridoxal phosphate-dependent enzyme [Colwellia sp. UCD-KL20]|uniref:aminotransferase class III-fold pyridoxal phosphate-dependent enzyme n=1 Tax=Colwellia sp. UCD-KL20 TaxID=1917165 RepID=UPI0009710DD3|nr:aminotransferase class III-fold pyridoxal phosphate-dependent enzyme [Colwellia sp. UCD-KL20]